MTKSEVCGVNYEPGTWFTIVYGFNRHLCYVLRVTETEIQWSMPSWLVEDGHWSTKEELNNSYHRAHYVGKTNLKWYWRFLPWRNLIVPYYAPKFQ